MNEKINSLENKINNYFTFIQYQNILILITISISILFSTSIFRPEYLKYSGSLFLIIMVISIIYFKKNSTEFFIKIKENDYKKKKLQLFEKYKNLIEQDFFSKIDGLKEMLNNKYSKTSVYKLRVLSTIERSINIYIENIKKIDTLQKMSKTDFKKEIDQINENNQKIIITIDSYIHRLIEKSLNESEINETLSDFERHIKILEKL